ncbi:YjgN family protein [Methylobacterium sp. 10]|nr:YjgN family protein [Methylobacterium sp. 10]
MSQPPMTETRSGMDRSGAITFDRTLKGLTGIAVRGFLLSLVTFGIYRFW